MTNFSISDFTPAGAFCNAMNAAHESDLNNRVIDRATVKPAKTAPLLVMVWERVEAVIQSCRKPRAETA